MRTAAATRQFDPARDLIVARANGVPVGYALVESTPQRAICGEVVAGSHRVRRSLIAEVERRSNGQPVVFQHTPVTDSLGFFRGRGYTVLASGWYTLMANSLGRRWGARAAVEGCGTTDRRFLCQSGDRF